MDRIDRIRGILRKIEILESVEHLRDMNAAGTGRGKTNNLAIAITRADRLPQRDLIFPKILGGDQAVVIAHPLLDLFSKGRFVEPFDAMLRGLFVAGGELWLFQNFTGFVSFLILFEQGSVG